MARPAWLQAAHEKLEGLRARGDGAAAAAKFRLRVRRRCEREGVTPPPWALPVRQVKARAASAPVDCPLALPVEIPHALREWRSAAPGRIVAVGCKGVRLWPGIGEPPAVFPDLPSAIAAVRTG